MQIGYKLATEVRYHPAIIAQAAATMAIVSGGRFTLGVGAGERLNEHVTGLGFPGERVRHERAGFGHLVAMNAGPDPDGFMDFFARELAEPLRALQPGGGVRDQG
jgi:alkanesulfonate monooxygenase SsuD/methylene tetrahydromethanopterin reductase-like flavin-dependent oxidoreductase (luciferase family)